ncbi:unnamed protein product [Cyclocybe aegerita]|uniref:F-box domain-containing protein n=1 Tax=Cyclocybe aegerita TaxID=1973307 RepID=A0A8S0VZK2_CYCAE|nr:unnamed protein product [Cyclocybe aegerita]
MGKSYLISRNSPISFRRNTWNLPVTTASAFIATTMLSTNCPVEVWLEILTYLPRTSLLVTCTLNKLFFDLSLNQLYEEIILDSGDSMIKERFEIAMRVLINVANHVRRLTVLPARLNDSLKPTSSNRQITFLNCLCHLEDLRCDFAGSPRNSFRQATRFLDVSTSDSPICLINLQELTVTLSSWLQSQSFFNFYNTMWEKKCIGPNVQKISIEAPPLDLQFLITSMLRYGCTVLKNVTHISLHLRRSPYTTTSDKNQVYASLTKLMNLLGASLRSLSLSSADPNIDFSVNLTSLPRLRGLQNFEYRCPFHASSLVDMTKLTEFIGKYSTQQSQLVVIPSMMREWGEDDGHPAGESYSKWITSTDSRDVKLPLQIGLSHLVLPALRYLATRPAD